MGEAIANSKKNVFCVRVFFIKEIVYIQFNWVNLNHLFNFFQNNNLYP